MSRGVLLDIAHQNSQSSDENLSFGKTLKEWPSIHLPRRCAKNKFLMIFFVLLLHPWESQHPAVFISVQRGSSRCCLPIFTVFRWKFLIWEDFERVYFFLFTSRATSWCAASRRSLPGSGKTSSAELFTISLYSNYPSLWKFKTKSGLVCF